ncbi:glycosyltransferase family 2 protein [Microbacterium sp. zg-YB36]|uniref:glycosyltransferase family 2 protein n=1 Tax=Microbacterium sp. zg-YB36 TaxID=2969407 RepID=UPI00214C3635|nr:glycosyltransferase family 2 protein [Microbacterium sp. zg-YB36]MDL5352326.1 glycosyltransferase family 2 protein [Microbacterium sp. zg-YB36]
MTLTSYPARVRVVHRTVKSLLMQSVGAPVVLYLAAEEFPQAELDLPPPLRRLVRRHRAQLSIRWVDTNTRSYKKLVPAIEEFPSRKIVTADDDVLYSRGWLALLASAAEWFPNTVIGTRGTTISFNDDGEFAPYTSWPEAPALEASNLVFLTGRGGILYPPNGLAPIAAALDLAAQLAPSADDIWFKAAAGLAGTPAMRVAIVRDYAPSGASQEHALYHRNVGASENDATFSRVISHFGLSFSPTIEKRSTLYSTESNENVLVVIPTLGSRPEWLRASVSSVIKSAESAGVHVRVRLVAPKRAGLTRFAQELGIELLESERPGLSAAINDGWSAPHSAKYVAWLGDDDLLSPGSLGSTIAALDADPVSSAAYGKVRFISETGATMWMMRPGWWAQWYVRLGKNLVPQPGALFRWSAVVRVGKLDESLTAAMDQDLFMRLGQAARLRYVPTEVAAFRIHPASITSTHADSIGSIDESARLREKYSKWAKLVRPLTSVTDRLVFGVMRRLPVAAAPKAADGSAYTA